ncbi:MAG TPA: CYTH domain-containing protein, partial [Chitinophagales bacterium]|nr:CYTH domain-containing protein [Chitinophagales bacterium]
MKGGCGIMGIKRVYLLMTCLLPYYIFCQATEEQSKLTGTDIDLVGELIVFDGQLGSLSVHRHDNYIYRDIYFDTPDFDLYNNGYSLRIRSRYFNADSIVY